MILSSHLSVDVEQNYSIEQLANSAQFYFHRKLDKLGFFHSIKRSNLCLISILITTVLSLLTAFFMSLDTEKYASHLVFIFTATTISLIVTVFLMDGTNSIAYEERIENIKKKLLSLSSIERLLPQKDDMLLFNIGKTITVLNTILKMKQNVAKTTMLWIAEEDIRQTYLRDQISDITYTAMINDLISCISNFTLILKKYTDPITLSKISNNELEILLDELDNILDKVFDNKLKQYEIHLQ